MERFLDYIIGFVPLAGPSLNININIYIDKGVGEPTAPLLWFQYRGSGSSESIPNPNSLVCHTLVHTKGGLMHHVEDRSPSRLASWRG